MLKLRVDIIYVTMIYLYFLVQWFSFSVSFCTITCSKYSYIGFQVWNCILFRFAKSIFPYMVKLKTTIRREKYNINQTWYYEWFGFYYIIIKIKSVIINIVLKYTLLQFAVHRWNTQRARFQFKVMRYTLSVSNLSFSLLFLVPLAPPYLNAFLFLATNSCL